MRLKSLIPLYTIFAGRFADFQPCDGSNYLVSTISWDQTVPFEKLKRIFLVDLDVCHVFPTPQLGGF